MWGILVSLLTCYCWYIWCDAFGNRTILGNPRSSPSTTALFTTSWIKSPLSPPTTTGTTPDPGRRSAATTSGAAGWDGHGVGNSLTNSIGIWLSDSACRGRVGLRRIPNSNSGYTLVEFKAAQRVIVLDTLTPKLKNGMDKPSMHGYVTFVRKQHEQRNKEKDLRMIMEERTTNDTMGWSMSERWSCCVTGGLFGVGRRCWANVEMKTAPTPICPWSGGMLYLVETILRTGPLM